MEYLDELPTGLVYAFFQGNPCALLPSYRLDVIKNLKELQELDEEKVSKIERRIATGEAFSDDE